ncbi:MAG: hypothetical protein V1900_00080 [Candidatus Aenigmatarchaeota archaeon]
MRGMLPGIFWTVILWVIFVFVIIFILFVSILTQNFGKGSQSYSIAFVEYTNEPYLVAQALSQWKDSSLFEQSIETIAIGRADIEIKNSFEEFLKEYDINYKITLKDTKTYMSVGKERGFEFTIPLFYKDKIGYLVIS